MTVRLDFGIKHTNLFIELFLQLENVVVKVKALWLQEISKVVPSEKIIPDLDDSVVIVEVSTA